MCHEQKPAAQGETKLKLNSFISHVYQTLASETRQTETEQMIHFTSVSAR